MTYTLMDVYKMDGINDLPMKVRTNLAKAWLAEHLGNTAEANAFLDAAVEAEIAINNESKK